MLGIPQPHEQRRGCVPIEVGGYFGLATASPTLASAALVADNGNLGPELAQIARGNGAAVVLDNTWATPLLFPALAALPRAPLGVVRSPVERWAVAASGGGELWVKRDDATAGPEAGNKLRKLVARARRVVNSTLRSWGIDAEGGGLALVPGNAEAPTNYRANAYPFVQDGTFAKEWIAKAKSGRKNFNAMKEKDKNHPVEVVGKKLRKLMSWINSKEID